MSDPVALLVIGAGSRGAGYAEFARHFPERARVLGVAEPRDVQRAKLAGEHLIPIENVFSDWRDAAARHRIADAVIIATQDSMHEEPALAFAELGYDILLEKPMAPNEDSCRRIVEAAKNAGVLFGVCHVLRYTRQTKALMDILPRIGDIACIQRLEDVAYWHQAHSFVRGNWRSEAESSPMLLSKACHDLDWIRHVIGVPCLRVSSFGSLKHFRAEEKPDGAGDRCLDCAIEPTCPYSAPKLYFGMLEKGKTTWPVNVITDDLTPDGVAKALRDGPYGRCVYGCDNDVVDTQVVNMEFEGGRTASFTMTAFGPGGRKTSIFGTRGQITLTDETITLTDFLSGDVEEISPAPASEVMAGHSGGDFGIMDAFVRAVAERDPSQILSGPDETLETHRMVFAAERARLAGSVEAL